MKGNPTEQFNYRSVAVVMLLIVAVSFFIDVTTLKSFVLEAGIWAPIVFILLKILTIIIAPISGGPLYPLVGLFFGFWPGILYVAIGDLVGYSGAFLISRYFGKSAVDRLVSSNENGLMARMVEKIGTSKGFFQACITCFALPELLSYAAGLSRLAYWKFILILWPASVVGTSILVLLGASFDMSEQPLLISLLVPLLGTVCVLVGGTFFIKGLKKDEKEN